VSDEWYLRLGSPELGEAIEGYLDLWNLHIESGNAGRLEALGVPLEDFEAVFRAFVMGIEKMGYQGADRERHLLLLGLGVGRGLGIIQATSGRGA
jgi:hypothetical protein